MEKEEGRWGGRGVWGNRKVRGLSGMTGRKREGLKLHGKKTEESGV